MTPAFSGEVHPFAASFPMLPGSELDDLAADIAVNGQLHPILLDPDGMLLDGRNRLAACERAGVEPVFDVHNGDPLALIVSANVSRRSLSGSQRAAARAKSLGLAGKRVVGSNGKPRWKRGSGDNANSALSRAESVALTRCGVLWDHDPALLDRAIQGEALEPLVGMVEDQQASEKERALAEQKRRENVDTLTAAGYMERVTDGALTYDEAWTLYQKDTEATRAREAAEIEKHRKVLAELASAVSALTPYANPDTIAGLTVDDFDHAHDIDRTTITDLRLLGVALEGLSAYIDWLENAL